MSATAMTTVASKIAAAPSFHLIGAGSIGLFWAATIRSKYPTYPIKVLLRPKHKNRIITMADQLYTNANEIIEEDNYVQVQISKRYDAAEPMYGSSSSSSSSNNNKRSSKNSNDDEQLPIIHLPVELLRDANASQDHEGDSQSMNSSSSTTTIENLIVSTKAHQAIDAVESVYSSLLPGCNIILLCNGALSVRDELKAMMKEKETLPHDKAKIVLATTTHGVYQEPIITSRSGNNSSCTKKKTVDPYHIVHAGYGKSYVEDTSTPQQDDEQHLLNSNNNNNSVLPNLATLWNDCGLNCKSLTQSEMLVLLWQKLAANCVINPLSTIYKCRNGELLMEPHIPPIQHELLNEISNVATQMIMLEKEEENAADLHPDDDDDDDDEKLVVVNDERLSSYSLSRFVNQVMQDTLYNKSSMLQDINNNRRTEISHLNGYIVKKGRELNIDVHTNEDLLHRINEIENSTISSRK